MPRCCHQYSVCEEHDADSRRALLQRLKSKFFVRLGACWRACQYLLGHQDFWVGPPPHRKLLILEFAEQMHLFLWVDPWEVPRFSRAGLPGRPAAERGQQCTLPPQLSQQLEQSVPDGHRSRETKGVSLLFVGGSSLVVLLARRATVAVVTKEHLCSLLRTSFEEKQRFHGLCFFISTHSVPRGMRQRKGIWRWFLGGTRCLVKWEMIR